MDGAEATWSLLAQNHTFCCVWRPRKAKALDFTKKNCSFKAVLKKIVVEIPAEFFGFFFSPLHTVVHCSRLCCLQTYASKIIMAK